jgi:hypothetical protein
MLRAVQLSVTSGRRSPSLATVSAARAM